MGVDIYSHPNVPVIALILNSVDDQKIWRIFTIVGGMIHLALYTFPQILRQVPKGFCFQL